MITRKIALDTFNLISTDTIRALLSLILSGDLGGALSKADEVVREGKDYSAIAYELGEAAKVLLLEQIGRGAGGIQQPSGDILPLGKIAELGQIMTEAGANMHYSADKSVPLKTAIISAVYQLHTASVDEVLEILPKIAGGGRASSSC